MSHHVERAKWALSRAFVAAEHPFDMSMPARRRSTPVPLSVIDRRADLLVAVAHGLARQAGLDPDLDPKTFAAAWRRAHPQSLRELALIARVIDPRVVDDDQVLFDAFFAKLDERAKGQP